jgi:indolepyruvate ferredoxin oxidoreductase beta subunit
MTGIGTPVFRPAFADGSPVIQDAGLKTGVPNRILSPLAPDKGRAADSRPVNIYLCGTGGQGILKAAEIVAWAAAFDGWRIKKSEVHGMAQRGGSVESHVRYGRVIHSPIIPVGTADFLVPFERNEHDRTLAMLRPGGVDLLGALERAGAIKDRRFVNTFMLGALAAHAALSVESWRRAIERVFAGKFLEENLAVFEEGRCRGE